MKDNIVRVDTREACNQDMARYSLYVLYNRCVPDIRDGLKPVQRRILTSMYYEVKCLSSNTRKKSARVVGDVMGKYHPHGDSSIYGAMKPLTNWFESKMPLICYDSSSGSIQGGDQAAMRYTESYMSQFAQECVIGELKESGQIIDWQPTFDNQGLEPESLPVKIPLLLVNGVFSIAIGEKIEVPSHNLNDVIDATLTLLHNPNAKIVLIPDPCMPCEIVDTDWKKISNMGFGNYIVRGIVDILHDSKTGIDALSIKSTPDLVFSDTIKSKVEDLVKDNKIIGIADIQDESTENQLDLRIILKKGTDPNYIKQMLYKHTSLQDSRRVNMMVITEDNEVKRFSYKAYILYFLEYRKRVKFRLYNFRLQKIKTRLHQIDTYIKILESGDVENIIHMIRNQSSMDESFLIDWLMKKLKITDLQAKFILGTPIGKLSKGFLGKYKAEQKELLNKESICIQYITNEDLINKEIEDELIDIKNKYGSPRKSIIISESQASNIPSGTFKIVITEANFVKKLQLNDPIKSIKGDNPKFILTADNDKDILLFDQMGKVFRLQVSKIPFSEKSSAGIDIRLLIKNLTSNIISAIYVPTLELLANKRSKYYICIITAGALIKRIDLDDIINAATSGIIYTKLNSGDFVRDILVVNNKSDIVVYTKSRALRIPVEATPHLKRSTLGSLAMKTKDPIDGMSVITRETTDIVVVTAKGKFNRFSSSGLPVSNRNTKDNKVIALSKGDKIINIFSCNSHNSFRVITDVGAVEISLKDIPTGSSISSGTKLIKDNIIKVEMIRN